MHKSDIIQTIRSMRSDTTHGWPDATKRRAPHKPFLLLSVIDGVEQGWIRNNKITLCQPLIDTFSLYWDTVMGERQTTIAHPFFYMKSSLFWKLRYKPGVSVIQGTPSVARLRKKISHAEIDRTLFAMMADRHDREILRRLIISEFFSSETDSHIQEIREFGRSSFDYASSLDELLKSPFEIDHTKDEGNVYQTVNQQVRDRGFSMKVRMAYGNTCAVCRGKVITPEGRTLVDSAHILPFNTTNNNDPRNGLALCKTHHWMFDHYMLTVRPDYRLQLSDWLRLEDNNAEETLRWADSEILLPAESGLFPAGVALQDHNKRFEEAQT